MEKGPTLDPFFEPWSSAKLCQLGTRNDEILELRRPYELGGLLSALCYGRSGSRKVVAIHIRVVSVGFVGRGATAARRGFGFVVRVLLSTETRVSFLRRAA